MVALAIPEADVERGLAGASWRLERRELIEDKQEERARETLAWC